MSAISYFIICEGMNQSLSLPLTEAKIVNADFKGKVKRITKARVAPGSCTVEYKQLETCKQIIQCCSARPKPILSDPKMKQEGKV
jgi:hypothetical protein